MAATRRRSAERLKSNRWNDDMNIKNRIKRVEDGLGLNTDSAFCRCEREMIIKVQPRDKSGNLPEPEPEMCADCGKPIDRFLFTFNFNNNTKINLIRPSYRVIEPGDDEQQNQYEH